jgi:hypothetical protein
MKANQKYTKENIGRMFQFTIHDTIKLPPDNEPCLIIQDEEKYHFTIPLKYFQKYGFKTGDRWEFRLDSIDCDNNVTFEPHHPVYCEKTIETFEIIGHKTIINYLEMKEDVIMVQDKLSNIGNIHLCNGIIPDTHKIDAWIERIKKGELLLMPVIDHVPIFKTGILMPFKIIGQKNLPQLGKSHILKDKSGNLHPLPLEPFRHYHLLQGTTISAEIRRISNKGFLHLEPMHPVYQTGEVYSFGVLDIIRENQLVHGFVEDIFGNPVKVEGTNLIQGERIKCKVIRLEKGLPVLELANLNQ